MGVRIVSTSLRSSAASGFDGRVLHLTFFSEEAEGTSKGVPSAFSGWFPLETSDNPENADTKKHRDQWRPEASRALVGGLPKADDDTRRRATDCACLRRRHRRAGTLSQIA